MKTLVNSKLDKNALACAIIISGMSYAFVISGASFAMLVLSQSFFLFWVLLNFFFIKKIKFSKYGVYISIALSLILLTNLLINSGNYVQKEMLFFTIAHIAGVVFFSFSIQWTAVNVQPKNIFRYMAWLIMPLIIWAIFDGWTTITSSRFTPMGIHPNWWGELAFGFILCSLLLKKLSIRVFFILAGTLLIYMVQSRGALFASYVSIISIWVLSYRPFKSKSFKRAICFVSIFSFVCMYLMLVEWDSYIFLFFEDNVLLINDPYRGVGTGLTGRVPNWKIALEIFWENPVFGYGFDLLNGVHNGFLRWATEGGILLLGFMVMVISFAIVRAWYQSNNFILATLFGMIAYFMTYPRALNLNIVGILFLFTLFRWKLENQN